MTANIPTLPSLYDPLPPKPSGKVLEDNQVYKADPERGGKPYCIMILRPMSPAACTWVTPSRARLTL